MVPQPIGVIAIWVVEYLESPMSKMNSLIRKEF